MLFERHLKTSIIICFASKLRFQSIKLKFYSSTVFDCLNWLSKEKKDWYPNVRIHSPVASISDHCWTDRNWIKPSKSPVMFWIKISHLHQHTSLNHSHPEDHWPRFLHTLLVSMLIVWLHSDPWILESILLCRATSPYSPLPVHDASHFANDPQRNCHWKCILY